MTTPPEGQPPQPSTGLYGAPPLGPYAQGDPYAAPVGYGASPPPLYGAPPGGHGPASREPPTDVVSIVGLVMAFVLAPVGLVLSILGLTRTAGGRRKGRGLAVAGLVVSVVMTVLGTLALVALVAVVRDASDDFELPDTFPTAETFPTSEPFPSLDALPAPGPRTAGVDR